MLKKVLKQLEELEERSDEMARLRTHANIHGQLRTLAVGKLVIQ